MCVHSHAKLGASRRSGSSIPGAAAAALKSNLKISQMQLSQMASNGLLENAIAEQLSCNWTAIGLPSEPAIAMTKFKWLEALPSSQSNLVVRHHALEDSDFGRSVHLRVIDSNCFWLIRNSSLMH